MNYKLKGLFLLICAACAGLLTMFFFSHAQPVEADMPLVTSEMIAQHREQLQQKAHQRQSAEAARKRADLEIKMYQCRTNDECIIVDRDPCGCLRGPEGVTAINSNFSLEFSRLTEKQFAKATACPSVGSSERECSASAEAACVAGRCKIIY